MLVPSAKAKDPQNTDPLAEEIRRMAGECTLTTEKPEQFNDIRSEIIYTNEKQDYCMYLVDKASKSKRRWTIVDADCSRIFTDHTRMNKKRDLTFFKDCPAVIGWASRKYKCQMCDQFTLEY